MVKRTLFWIECFIGASMVIAFLILPWFTAVVTHFLDIYGVEVTVLAVTGLYYFFLQSKRDGSWEMLSFHVCSTKAYRVAEARIWVYRRAAEPVLGPVRRFFSPVTREIQRAIAHIRGRFA